jgi:hypothetical protein
MLQVLVAFLMAMAAILLVIAGLWLADIWEAWRNGDGPERP